VNGETWIRYGLNRGSHYVDLLSLSLALSKRNRLACLRFFFSPCALACDPALPFSLSLSVLLLFFVSRKIRFSLNFVSRSVEFGFLDLTLLSGKFQAL